MKTYYTTPRDANGQRTGEVEEITLTELEYDCAKMAGKVEYKTYYEALIAAQQ